MAKLKKKKLRRNRFKTITFKLSARQNQSLLNYSKMHHTTPLKVIKDLIHDPIEEYSTAQISKEIFAKNQLDLFNYPTDEEQQLEIFQ